MLIRVIGENLSSIGLSLRNKQIEQVEEVSWRIILYMNVDIWFWRV